MFFRSIGQRPLALFSLLFSVLILFYKRPDSFLLAQFWGEEGTIFFSEAYHQGYKSVFNTCAGYFHLYPRLVFCTTLFLHFPMVAMPFVSSYAWLAIFVLVLYYIWKRVQLEPLQKFYVAIGIVLIPIQSEVLMNLTNVQWIMAIFPFIIFAYPAHSKKWRWLDNAVLFMVAFTGPNLLIFLPILLFLILTKRIGLADKATRFLVVITIISAIATISSLVSFGGIDRTKGVFDPANPAFANYVYVQYALLFISRFAFDTPQPLIYAAAVLIIGFIVYYCLRILKRKVDDPFRILTFFGSVVFMVTTLISYRHVPSTLHPHYGAARNFFLPALFCTWFVLTYLKFGKRNNIIAACFMLMLLCNNFAMIPRVRTTEKSWSSYAPKIRTADTLMIPIDPPGWYVFIDNRAK